MTALTELADTVRTLSRLAGPAVVGIGRHGRGSGFVIAPGKVLTNAHNLRDRTTSVTFADGRTDQGRATGSDLDGDLVVLDVETGQTPALAFAEDQPDLGDIVFTVTAGRGQQRTTWGQVSAVRQRFSGPRGRAIDGAFEHTAPAAPGSSGSPVLNAEGQVLGVNTHRPAQGFYLARAADEALRERISRMTAGERFHTVRLGVAVAPSEVARRLRKSVGLAERTGLLVRAVEDDSPAARAGVAEGDLLVRAGDRELTRPTDLFEVLSTVSAPDELELGIVRGSDELSVTVRFTQD